VVLIGFFGQSSSPISHQFHLAVLHRPPLTPENCIGLILHAPGAPTNKILSGDEIATPLASFQIGSIITGFPHGLKPQKSSAALSSRCTPAPRPPHDENTLWSAASQVRDVYTPLPPSRTMRTRKFPKNSKISICFS